ncbi:MAG TPA: aminotransferase class V-fold PLP-dependent enzyme, partial [Candidatus Flavonifractor intestinigallinarum]|nr:aminotransferase class V-fold PLP-dependent enzyme [Candidatus Flavonifractor intestinigallinarum]
CRRRRVPLIVDASQSAGCLPVRQEKLGAAFIAMPGHKGLYGPQGTGLLLCAGEAVPLIQGGTGSASALQTMPDYLPDRLEAGTHNLPGIAGLLAGLRYVAARTPEAIGKREGGLIRRAAQGLARLPRVRAFQARNPACQSGVLSFQVEGMDCEAVGEALSRRGIALRAGLHCAPLAHENAGTLEVGTVRMSVSDFNTAAEVDRFVWELSRLVQSSR